MSTEQPDERTTALLLLLGRCADDTQSATAMRSLQDNAFVRSIGRFRNFEWLQRLPWEDACSIVKSITRLEEARLTHSCGSVSAVKDAYLVLEQRDCVAAMELAAWIVDNTSNDYIPFPMRKTRYAFKRLRHVAKSWQDLRARLDAWSMAESERQARVAREMENQGPEGQHRRIIRNSVAARLCVKQLSLQRARAAARVALLDQLRALPMRDRLEHLAWDSTHSLAYFPADLAPCSPQDLQLLDPVTREKLITKLRARKKGPWCKLAKRLLCQPAP